MRFKDIERFNKLGQKENSLEGLTPHEDDELLALRQVVREHCGDSSDSAGFVVVANAWWMYRPYLERVDAGLIEQSDEFESRLYWKLLRAIEKWVLENGSKKLLGKRMPSGPGMYYRNLSFYLSQERIKSGDEKEWNPEILTGKWMGLRRELVEMVRGLVGAEQEDAKGNLPEKIEDRIEPLFNKLLKDVSDAVDGGDLTPGEKLKMFDRLSGLLADMKGERQKGPQVVVTHNNVFAKIMSNKGDGKVLEAKAEEILEGEGYELQ